VSRIPVTIIGGYLGAGKTTLVNHLLRNADGHRLAILVNDFGDLPIDADLIEQRSDKVISIAGGCICCSFGSDLMGALIELQGKGGEIDQIVIETSGVALPGGVERSLQLMPGLTIGSTFVLVDGETIRVLINERYMADTVRRQLADADIVLLNKIDLLDESGLSAARAVIERFVRAPIVPVQFGQAPVELIFDRGAQRGGKRPRQKHELAALDTISLVLDDRCFDVELLSQRLSGPETGLLRAKGFVKDPAGRFVSFQLVGRRVRTEPAPEWIDGQSRLVFIGPEGQIDRDALTAILAACERKAAGAGE
jgi:G3E family GTPase